ncbi:MAG: hypothetical protein H6627_09410 [Calditrichae bacterium]|nr:hypothetical protein [Calditrichota bacterium]MCB9058773.1 hypothetical protein [Calditrichia bacterium]
MKYLLSAFLVTLLFSCNQQKVTQLESELAQIKSQNEMIREQSQSKDRFIEEYTSTLNEVYDNLESIRKREGLITEYSKSLEKSKQASVKEKMISNIQSIDSYINRSKQKLSTLRTRFQESEVTSKSFEETIEKLTKELEEKEMYIAELRGAVDSLNNKVSLASVALKQRDMIIEEQTEQMNMAYYVIGTDEELEQKSIITEKGGLLGIGKTTVVADSFNNDDFNKTDIVNTEEIKIEKNVDDIEIVSSHDPESYELVAEGNGETRLAIKNPNNFWKMRYLVIITKS